MGHADISSLTSYYLSSTSVILEYHKSTTFLNPKKGLHVSSTLNTLFAPEANITETASRVRFPFFMSLGYGVPAEGEGSKRGEFQDSEGVGPLETAQQLYQKRNKTQKNPFRTPTHLKKKRRSPHKILHHSPRPNKSSPPKKHQLLVSGWFLQDAPQKQSLQKNKQMPPKQIPTISFYSKTSKPKESTQSLREKKQLNGPKNLKTLKRSNKKISNNFFETIKQDQKMQTALAKSL